MGSEALQRLVSLRRCLARGFLGHSCITQPSADTVGPTWVAQVGLSKDALWGLQV